jgi:hypothetical protein
VSNFEQAPHGLRQCPAISCGGHHSYQEHDHNRCVLFVRQDRVAAVQHDRQAGGSWRRRQLAKPGAALVLPGIGTIGRLGDLYSFTPLDPFAKH